MRALAKDSIDTAVSDQQIEMPLVKSQGIADESCVNQRESASEVIPADTILPVSLGFYVANRPTAGRGRSLLQLSYKTSSWETVRRFAKAPS
jgi:hypothetical protein